MPREENLLSAFLILRNWENSNFCNTAEPPEAKWKIEKLLKEKNAYISVESKFGHQKVNKDNPNEGFNDIETHWI